MACDILLQCDIVYCDKVPPHLKIAPHPPLLFPYLMTNPVSRKMIVRKVVNPSTVCFTLLITFIYFWHHDIQLNETRHNGLIWDIQHDGIQHYDTQNSNTLLLCWVSRFLIVILNVIMLNITMLSVAMLYVVMLNDVMLSVVMLIVIMLTVFMLN